MIVPFIRFVRGRNDRPDGDGRKYGIAIHNTSNDASDTGEADYATRRTDNIGSHFYADVDSVTQSIDTAYQVNHAGSAQGNQNAICVEITGGNGKDRAWWLANVDWDELGRVLAAVIRYHWPDGSFQVRRAPVAEMKSNPKVKAFYGHDDMRLAWGGTTHTDPGPGFPWDRLFTAVNAALGDSMAAVEYNTRANDAIIADTSRLLSLLSNSKEAKFTVPSTGEVRTESNGLAEQLHQILSQVKDISTGISQLPQSDIRAFATALAVELEPKLKTIVQAAAEAGAEAALRRVLGSLGPAK